MCFCHLYPRVGQVRKTLFPSSPSHFRYLRVAAWTNKIVSIMTTGKYDDDGNTREDHASYLGGTM